MVVYCFGTHILILLHEGYGCGLNLVPSHKMLYQEVSFNVLLVSEVSKYHMHYQYTIFQGIPSFL